MPGTLQELLRLGNYFFKIKFMGVRSPVCGRAEVYAPLKRGANVHPAATRRRTPVYTLAYTL